MDTRNSSRYAWGERSRAWATYDIAVETASKARDTLKIARSYAACCSLNTDGSAERAVRELRIAREVRDAALDTVKRALDNARAADADYAYYC